MNPNDTNNLSALRHRVYRLRRAIDDYREGRTGSGHIANFVLWRHIDEVALETDRLTGPVPQAIGPGIEQADASELEAEASRLICAIETHFNNWQTDPLANQELYAHFPSPHHKAAAA